MIGLLTRAAVVAQAPPHVRLDYQRGASTEICPDALALKQAVAARLGYAPFDDQSAVLVRVRIARNDAQHFIASIELQDAAGSVLGRRDVVSHESESCDELREALELALSVAIDPFGSQPAPPVEQKTPPAVLPQPAKPVTKPKAAPGPQPAPTSRLELGGSVHAAFGFAPSTTVGLDLEGRLRFHELSAGVALRADLPGSKEVGQGRISSTVVLATALACGHYEIFAGCALFGWGALLNSGNGFGDSQNAATPFYAAGARLLLALPVTDHAEWFVFGDLWLPLSKTTLTIGEQAVWRTPTLTGDLGVGLRWSFF